MTVWSRRKRSILACVISGAAALTAAAGSGTAAASPSASGGWQQYVLGPSQPDVHPVAVVSTSGEVTGAQALAGGSGAATLTMAPGGAQPTIVLDYGKDVSGVPYFDVAGSTGSPVLRASYSEGSQYIGPNGDGAASQSDSASRTRAETLQVSGPGTLSTGLIQGGERYQEIALTSPGTVQISSAGIRFSAYRATPGDYQGWFLSSSDELNRIWYQGAYTTQLDQLPANTLPAAWRVTGGSLDANGGNIAVLGKGASWSDYTDAFQTEILSRQAGWVVRSAADGSRGYLFILDADNDPANGGGPVNTLQRLYFDNGSYTSLGNVPLGADLAPGTWHDVRTDLAGTSITVSVDGRAITTLDTSSLPSGVPALTAGTVGFREYPGEEARFRNLSVTDTNGNVLYTNPLSDNSALADFTGAAVQTPDPLPVIMDGAKRDRVVWSGDLGVEGPNIFYSTAASDYVRGSLQLLASYQNANGESGTNVPPTVPVGSFPESGYAYSASYSMDEVGNIATYYRYTGDLAFVRAEWPMIDRELAYNRAMADSRGLVVTNSGNGYDWDYYDGAKTGAVAAYNIIYYQTLTGAATMAQALGRTAEAGTLQQQAAALRTAINDNLYDPQRHLYAVSDTRPSTAAQDANALAVVSGVAPDGEAGNILDALDATLPATPYGPSPFTANLGYNPAVSPFISDEQVRALFDAGHTGQALNLIHELWGHMAAPGPDWVGADWELVGTDGTPGFGAFTSLAHGWASGATAALSEYLLGVQPASAGYDTWNIAPHPGSVQWVRGQVPTPHGAIGVSWSQQDGHLGLNVTAPARTSGTITVPVPAAGATVVLHGHAANGAPVTGVVHAGAGQPSASFSIGDGGGYSVEVNSN